MERIDPFANNEESLEIGDLTIENRTKQVSIYGSIDITRDRRGLEKARQLATLLTSIIGRLEAEELPETIGQPTKVDTVKNPFE